MLRKQRLRGHSVPSQMSLKIVTFQYGQFHTFILTVQFKFSVHNAEVSWFTLIFLYLLLKEELDL